jgi:hypothetical protein
MRRSLALVARSVLVLGLFAGLVRCDWGPEPADRESLVVEAFVETGRPPPALLLRQIRPLDATGDPEGDAATGAQVTLTIDGQTVPYDEDSQQPGRYTPAVPVDSVPARVDWALDVQWSGERAQAHGRTPPSIRAAEVCVRVPDEPVRAVRVDSLRRDSLDIPTERGYIYLIDVTARWTSGGTAPGGSLDTTQWVRAQLRPDTSQFSSRLVDRFLQPVEVRREDRYREVGNNRQWTGVYAVPVDSSTAPLPRHRLTTAVVRGDSAFGDFARSRTDPDLREPISNVDGALGIATAVAVDSLVRVVTPRTEGCEGPDSTSARRIQSTSRLYNAP